MVSWRDYPCSLQDLVETNVLSMKAEEVILAGASFSKGGGATVESCWRIYRSKGTRTVETPQVFSGVG